MRSVLTAHKPRTRRFFCSRLVARAFDSAGIRLVPDPDYCTPEQIRRSPLLTEVQDMIEMVSPAELAAWAGRANPIAKMQDVQNRILAAARCLDPSVENLAIACESDAAAPKSLNRSHDHNQMSSSRSALASLGVGGCPPEAGTGLYLRSAPTKPPAGSCPLRGDDPFRGYARQAERFLLDQGVQPHDQRISGFA